jgi:hypothetical protein
MELNLAGKSAGSALTSSNSSVYPVEQSSGGLSGAVGRGCRPPGSSAAVALLGRGQGKAHGGSSGGLEGGGLGALIGLRWLGDGGNGKTDRRQTECYTAIMWYVLMVKI